ncbi:MULTISPECIES: trypco2 family protein [Vibrio]|uniref:trypco2 family protein n=1 Tax=Vibrio TaxID=662 RepID=UPI0004DF535A|nr:trypco2 family protein [Vibrio parahaemolyticus]EGQ9599485.1 hypothetical protein [Vibrio parahaemolyticus]EIE9609622.1 hypothetical protein [Vibrio parahaemolyticus]EJA3095928.1 hypothetical protein [Vibrio parahaemolyticus]ELA8137700.1 hypothetical protein [Vibrio parahaemolyticus]EMC9925371.1 hypothetical protein [Vibrio parahaemolyticus]
MKLSEFISSTLSEIVNGIEDANQQLIDKGVKVNPPNIYLEDNPNKSIYGVWNKNSLPMHPVVEVVEFDVTLTAEETSNSGGKAGVSIGVAKVSADGASSDRSSHVSRVKFKVPVIYPTAEP